MKDFVNAFKTFTDLISKYLVLMKQKGIQHTRTKMLRKNLPTVDEKCRCIKATTEA